MKKKNRKVIEIFQYKGKFGQYATRLQLLWKCEVVGVNGERRDGGDWMAEGCGNPKKKFAEQDAQAWHEFTGWPIVDLGRVTKEDEDDDYF